MDTIAKPMSPSHHPSAKLLADHVVGDCSPGSAMLISAHLEACAFCRGRTAELAWRGAKPVKPRSGRWLTLRPGLAVARVTGAGGLGEGVYRLRAGADHDISFAYDLSVGELLVQKGGFKADGRHFAAGDFVSLDEVALGPAQIDPGAACLCLVTIDETTADSWSLRPEPQIRQISSRRSRLN